MSEFLPRTEPVAAMGSATERGMVPQRVPKVERSTALTPDRDTDARVTPQTTARASYAQIRQRIASVLAGLSPPRAPVSDAVASADQAIGALIPQPVLVIPMPPTDPDMIAFVAQVAQSLAERSAQARVAHGGLRAATVEAALV